jgi:uncharacterized protein (TIGR03435 family)
MTRTLLLVPLTILLADFCHCEDTAKSPAFEVVSITPCKPDTPAPAGEDHFMVQLVYPGGKFHAGATTVKYLIEWAWNLLPSQFSGGPSWMDNDRYEIIAKAPGNANEEEMKAMVKTLLTDRFRLTFHRETRDAPVLLLAPGKTPPKLYPPKEGETTDLRVRPISDDAAKRVSFHVTATRFSFLQLNQTFAHILDRVIVNQTGIEGDFDFTLDIMPDDAAPSPMDPGLLISAMRDQLGLNVKSTRAPVEFLAIDGLERPTAN